MKMCCSLRREPLKEILWPCQLMYALATLPLIRKLKSNVNDVNKVWYADDASGASMLIRSHHSRSLLIQSTGCVNGGT